EEMMRKTINLTACLVCSCILGNGMFLSVSAQTQRLANTISSIQSPPVPIAQPLVNLTPEQAAANPILSARLASLFPEERNSVLVNEVSNRGVVNINTKSQQADFIFRIESENGGSGVVFDKRGHIITNYHVVEDAREIHVTLFNGNTYDAIPVGGDPATDLAVLKVDAPQAELFPIVLGDSAQLLVGEKIYAIGNPFGLERTFTSGVISNLNRAIGSQQRGRTIKQVIQIDAAINHGSSGGALLNTAGQLIGINTAIASQSGDNAGVGFAIPVNTVARIVPMLIKDGKVIRPDVGIYRVLSGEEGGVYAVLIEQGGPADKAGVIGPMPIVEQVRSPGFFSERRSIKRAEPDLITAVNNKPVNSGEDFITFVEENRPGETIVLTIVRKGKQLNIPVTLK
ncbi:MAG: trypsin-like peptidase domain-containing protein, partial [Planctomycetaceae bacterium]|nr:trypsin-like peptidase domain-containing protein [Planctomycetaceae bacterium]